MAFRGPGINPNTTSVTAPQGVGTRRTLVASTGPTTPTTLEPTGATPTPVKPVLPPEAGLFGGSLPPSRTGVELRERQHGDARRFQAFHPNTRVPGPFLLAEQGAGAVPVYPLPKRATEVFAQMARGVKP